MPAGCLGDIDKDLVAPILFMMSPGVAYTTGQTLDVCGGVSLYNEAFAQFQSIMDQNSTDS